MANTVKYTTEPSDRWDLIAYKAYGTLGKVLIDGVQQDAMAAIMQANTNVPYKDELPSNIAIFIPVQDAPAQKTSLTPPWKRNQ